MSWSRVTYKKDNANSATQRLNSIHQNGGWHTLYGLVWHKNTNAATQPLILSIRTVGGTPYTVWCNIKNANTATQPLIFIHQNGGWHTLYGLV